MKRIKEPRYAGRYVVVSHDNECVYDSHDELETALRLRAALTSIDDPCEVFDRTEAFLPEWVKRAIEARTD